MRIPRTIKIGSRKIKIIFKEMKPFGESDYARGVIWLRKGMPQEATEATLIHEAMHLMNTTMRHSTLDSLAEQIYQMLKDNKFLK